MAAVFWSIVGAVFICTSDEQFWAGAIITRIKTRALINTHFMYMPPTTPPIPVDSHLINIFERMQRTPGFVWIFGGQELMISPGFLGFSLLLCHVFSWPSRVH